MNKNAENIGPVPNGKPPASSYTTPPPKGGSSVKPKQQVIKVLFDQGAETMSNRDQDEIEALKRRIAKLEARVMQMEADQKKPFPSETFDDGRTDVHSGIRALITGRRKNPLDDNHKYENPAK
ncbi:hypothetical protein [Ponticaulis profundi]|uniref:Uncharacterized protein n=1 Tax=Ponticaulis profundi TaxID=2665222 RepID=A0ABW1S8I7_9PROT